MLEAGFNVKDRPCIVLLHGFPELAYSWRKVMLPLAAAGFHVIAPDRRGYGQPRDGMFAMTMIPVRLQLLTRFAMSWRWLPHSVIVP